MKHQLHNARCLRKTSVEVGADLCLSPTLARNITTANPANSGSYVVPSHNLPSAWTSIPLRRVGVARQKNIQSP
jgi:hypothetical protein